MTKLMTVLTGIILLSSTYAFGGENVCPGQFVEIGVEEAIAFRDKLEKRSPSDSHIRSRDKDGDGIICWKFTNEKTTGLRFTDDISKTN
jgi:hypothetical protein